MTARLIWLMAAGGRLAFPGGEQAFANSTAMRSRNPTPNRVELFP